MKKRKDLLESFKKFMFYIWKIIFFIYRRFKVLIINMQGNKFMINLEFLTDS